MSPYVAWAAGAIGVSVAVSIAVWVTGSAWPLLGLMFIPGLRSEKDK